MEKYAVSEHPLALSLQRSREELRSVLLPRGAESRNPPGQFPRSAVMQFLFNPRQRKTAMFLFSAVLLLLRRGGGPPIWLQLLRPLLATRAR